MKRRGFLARMGRGAGALAGLLMLPRCEAEPPGSTTEPGTPTNSTVTSQSLGPQSRDSLPVREALEALHLPEAPAAAALFQPYDSGAPFDRGWAIAHVAKGYDAQIMVVLVDIETGGHAELELWRPHQVFDPVAQTARYGVYINNGGDGAVTTPPHLRRLAEALARIVRPNESAVRLDWELPVLGRRS